MTWLFVILLAVAAFAGIAFVFKAPRGTWEAIGAALLLGIAGYAMQGLPSLAGSPKAAVQTISGDPAALVEARGKVTNSGIPTLNRWIVTADAFARNGRYADAADVLRVAVEEDPKSSEAWLAMATALVGHAEDTLTPAALYAYRRAIATDPDAPGPPFFLGLALAQAGQFAEARALWADLVARSKPDAPWRVPLVQQLQKLDAVMAGQSAAEGPAAPTPGTTPPAEPQPEQSRDEQPDPVAPRP